MLLPAVPPIQTLSFSNNNNSDIDVEATTSSVTDSTLSTTIINNCHSFKNEDCNNLISEQNFISSQEAKFNTEKSTNRLKRDIDSINTNTHIVENDCDLLPTISKKPKFLINDLLSAPKIAAAALLASVYQPNSLISQTNFNNHNSNNNCLKKLNISPNLKKKTDLVHKKLKQQSEHCLTNHSHNLETQILIPPHYVQNGNSSKLENVCCSLETENIKLWKNFHKIGTEMIITKPGR